MLDGIACEQSVPSNADVRGIHATARFLLLQTGQRLGAGQSLDQT